MRGYTADDLDPDSADGHSSDAPMGGAVAFIASFRSSTDITDKMYCGELLDIPGAVPSGRQRQQNRPESHAKCPGVISVCYYVDP